jgi:radical SAM superfamily enzyme YgiQ (UPF0313 family)
MNVILSTSPHVRHPAVLQNDFSIAQDVLYTFVPLGLLSLVSSARSRLSCVPRIFDLNRAIISERILLNNAFYSSVAEEILAAHPDVIGFMTECDSYHHVLQICDELRRQASEVCIVLGGPHASAVAEQTLLKNPSIDAIFVGESEESFPDFLQSFPDSLGKGITGTFSRDASGNVRPLVPRPQISDLNNLPVPAYDQYQPSAKEELFLEVGRGCPFHCSFCSTAPFWKRQHRVKSPKRIIEELRLLKELHDVKRVHFTHDLFTADRQWVMNLCQALETSEVDAKWTCSARADTVDRDLLETMRRAGCDAIYFGLESGSQRVLEQIGKKMDPAEALNILRLCREVGIKPNGGFIVGFPFEDAESFKETMSAYESALRVGAKPVHIFSFCPFADAAIYHGLDEMTCEGHFVDLPLPDLLRKANTARIQELRQLHASYFRPLSTPFLRDNADLIFGIDEFSTIVEAATIPTLMLCAFLGGMANLCREWISWIFQRNQSLGKAKHRSFYGTPTDYCEFLQEYLNKPESYSAEGQALSKVLAVGHEVATKHRGYPALTMATYRSLGNGLAATKLQLTDTLSARSVVQQCKVDFDVSPWLNAHPTDTLPTLKRETTHFVWFLRDERLELAVVSRQLYDSIEALFHKRLTVAQLLYNSKMADTPGAHDFFEGVKAFEEAMDAHILTRE